MTTKKRRPNVMAMDPTRTATLRRAFGAEILRRLDAVRRKIVQLVEVEDAFGLRSRPTGNRLTTNKRWAFQTSQEQLESFEDWLQEQFAEEVLDTTNGIDAYWEAYIRKGYEQGAGRSFDDVNRKKAKGSEDFYKGGREQFLKSAFGRPVSKERVQLLAGRVFTDLKGITQAASTNMARVLADGITRGQSPREVARALAGVIDGNRSRALTIARTETIRAHAEGQLDALELMGVTQLGVAVEWSTAGFNVCPLCVPLEGVVLTVKEARGLLPRHPNCRCSFIPANVGESDPNQKKTKKAVEKALDESVEAEIPEGSKRSLKEQKRRTSWAGADTAVAKTRPKSILDD